MGSCNTLNDLLNKVYVPNKTEDLNVSAFNMMTAINELKYLTEHMSCNFKCKFNGRKCNLNQKWNNGKNSKKICVYEKDYIWNPVTLGCENGKYIGSIIDDSVIT